MTDSPAKREIDRQQLEAFKRINGFSAADVDALRRFCRPDRSDILPESEAP